MKTRSHEPITVLLKLIDNHLKIPLEKEKVLASMRQHMLGAVELDEVLRTIPDKFFGEFKLEDPLALLTDEDVLASIINALEVVITEIFNTPKTTKHVEDSKKSDRTTSNLLMKRISVHMEKRGKATNSDDSDEEASSESDSNPEDWESSSPSPKKLAPLTHRFSMPALLKSPLAIPEATSSPMAAARVFPHAPQLVTPVTTADHPVATHATPLSETASTPAHDDRPQTHDPLLEFQNGDKVLFSEIMDYLKNQSHVKHGSDPVLKFPDGTEVLLSEITATATAQTVAEAFSTTERPIKKRRRAQCFSSTEGTTLDDIEEEQDQPLTPPSHSPALVSITSPLVAQDEQRSKRIRLSATPVHASEIREDVPTLLEQQPAQAIALSPVMTDVSTPVMPKNPVSPTVDSPILGRSPARRRSIVAMAPDALAPLTPVTPNAGAVQSPLPARPEQASPGVLQFSLAHRRQSPRVTSPRPRVHTPGHSPVAPVVQAPSPNGVLGRKRKSGLIEQAPVFTPAFQAATLPYAITSAAETKKALAAGFSKAEVMAAVARGRKK